MPKKRYDVNVFAVVNLKYLDVAADNPEEAVRQALETLHLDEMLNTANLKYVQPGVEYVQYADEASTYLVRSKDGEEIECWLGPDLELRAPEPETSHPSPPKPHHRRHQYGSRRVM